MSEHSFSWNSMSKICKHATYYLQYSLTTLSVHPFIDSSVCSLGCLGELPSSVPLRNCVVALICSLIIEHIISDKRKTYLLHTSKSPNMSMGFHYMRFAIILLFSHWYHELKDAGMWNELFSCECLPLFLITLNLLLMLP